MANSCHCQVNAVFTPMVTTYAVAFNNRTVARRLIIKGNQKSHTHLEEDVH